MKIVIDHLGKVKSSERETASASGLLLTNKRQKFTLQIGARVTPQALLSTCRHIRALNARVTIEAQTKSHLKYFPYPENTVPDTCLGLGRLALRLIEQRYELFRTDELRDFQDPTLGRLPRIMAPLLHPRLFTKETALALAQLDESDLSATSFVMPDGDKGFRIKKMPLHYVWPAPCPYLPLPLEEIVPSPFHHWYQALYHTALCVRRPLIHVGQMKLALRQSRKDDDGNPIPTAELVNHVLPHHADWYEMIRILYPLAAPRERPANYRLLSLSLQKKERFVIF